LVTVFEGDIQYLGFIGRWLLGQTYAYYGNVINSTFGYFALLPKVSRTHAVKVLSFFSAFYGGIAFFGFLGRTKWLAMLDALTAFSNSAIRVFISTESLSAAAVTPALYYRRGIYK
jgi:hypothetical protein